jgi:hypothetical protein
LGGAVVAVVGFVVTVCCVGDDEDSADVLCDVGTADARPGFTVLAMPHMRASVVLTILRSGLLGLHIFALISGDIALLGELAVDGGNIVGGEEVC